MMKYSIEDLIQEHDLKNNPMLLQNKIKIRKEQEENYGSRNFQIRGKPTGGDAILMKKWSEPSSDVQLFHRCDGLGSRLVKSLAANCEWNDQITNQSGRKKFPIGFEVGFPQP